VIPSANGISTSSTGKSHSGAALANVSCSRVERRLQAGIDRRAEQGRIGGAVVVGRPQVGLARADSVPPPGALITLLDKPLRRPGPFAMPVVDATITDALYGLPALAEVGCPIAAQEHRTGS
jgi:hypothetical protein